MTVHPKRTFTPTISVLSIRGCISYQSCLLQWTHVLTGLLFSLSFGCCLQLTRAGECGKTSSFKLSTAASHIHHFGTTDRHFIYLQSSYQPSLNIKMDRSPRIPQQTTHKHIRLQIDMLIELWWAEPPNHSFPNFSEI